MYTRWRIPLNNSSRLQLPQTSLWSGLCDPLWFSGGFQTSGPLGPEDSARFLLPRTTLSCYVDERLCCAAALHQRPWNMIHAALLTNLLLNLLLVASSADVSTKRCLKRHSASWSHELSVSAGGPSGKRYYYQLMWLISIICSALSNYSLWWMIPPAYHQSSYVLFYCRLSGQTHFSFLLRFLFLLQI